MSETEDKGWRDTILAGLANYIDAGSIVAGSVALAFWKNIYGLSDTFIGLIGAFSANAISAGVGALIGGWLCDKVGRKKIYQYDMIVYAVGMALLYYARHALDVETIVLDEGCLLIERWDAGRREEIRLDPYRTRILAPAPRERKLIELESHGRRVQLGAYVSEALRTQVAHELKQAIRSALL